MLNELHKFVSCVADYIDVVTFHYLTNIGDVFLNFCLHVCRDLVSKITQGLLSSISGVVSSITSLDQILTAAVFFGVGFGIFAHTLNLFLAQTR